MFVTSAPINAPFFILQSLNQVAVGVTPYPKLGCFDNDTVSEAHHGAIAAIHGRSNCDELGIAKSNNRYASPAFIRLHQVASVNGVNYYPVVTWCQQDKEPVRIQTPSCARAYLNGIGLNTTLGGDVL